MKLCRWPLYSTWILYALSVIYLFFSILKLDQQHFIYTLDDAYVHMSIAKNFSQHGVWGITPYEFTSSSSSILWTLILSLTYWIFGVSDAAPLVLNSVFAFGVIFCTYFILKSAKCSGLYTFFILLLVVFITPLPAMTFTGMEHVLHLLLLLIFAWYAVKSIAEENLSYADEIGLFCSAIALCMVRYEGLLTVFTACVLLLIKRKIKLSFFLGLSSLLPLIIFGAISLSKGGWFIPNTTEKLQLFSLDKFHHTSAKEILLPFLLLAIALITYALRSGKHSFFEPLQVWLGLLIGTIFIHLIVAPLGWFYRYEAYLIGFSIVVLGLVYRPYFLNLFGAHPKNYPQTIALGLLAFALIPPLLLRAKSFFEIPRASRNIYQQQYQMSRFVQDFYPDAWVACNDIGAICYYNDRLHCLDLFGLGNLSVVRAKFTGAFNRQFIEELVRSHPVAVIMIYEAWFKDIGIPNDWIKVGEWKVSDRLVLGGDTVAFYAPNEAKKDQLLRNLKLFKSQLPADVIQRGL